MTGHFAKNPRANTVLSPIGDTSLLPLPFEREGVTILGKCELLNPSGSVKDRLARHVLVDTEQREHGNPFVRSRRTLLQHSLVRHEGFVEPILIHSEQRHRP